MVFNSKLKFLFQERCLKSDARDNFTLMRKIIFSDVRLLLAID